MSNNGIVHSSRIPGRYFAMEHGDDDVQIVRREVQYVDQPSGIGLGTVAAVLILGAVIGCALSSRD